MRISTPTEYLAKTYGYEKTLEMIAAAGFDCADLSFYYEMDTGFDSPFMQDGYREFALQLKETAHRYGISFNQCHAPYEMDFSLFRIPGPQQEDLMLRIRRSIEIAGLVGATHIIVHVLQYLPYGDTDIAEHEQLNIEFYEALIPDARKAGVKICLENDWQYDSKSQTIRGGVCANVFELIRYIDRLNEKENCFCACLDVGHCAVTGYDPVKAIHALGSRLETVHMHDTDYKRDLHTLPLTAQMDHYAIAQSLKENGYRGDYTLEADSFLERFSPEFHREALAFMGKVARHLANKACGNA